MDLIDLINCENLSVRSVNICLSNGLVDTDLIGEYYKKNLTFLTIKNCGLKTEKELIAICNKYYNKSIGSKVGIDEIINSLTEKQQETIATYFDSRFHQLSQRPKKALQVFLGPQINVKKFLVSVSLEYFNFGLLPNVGKLAKDELNKFCDDLKTFIIENCQPGSNEARPIDHQAMIRALFPVSREELNDIFIDTGLDNFPLFKVINFLSSRRYFFTENEQLMFDNYFMYKIDSSKKELFQTSALKHITRERVRQLRNLFIENFAGKFSFIKNFNFAYTSQYGIDANADIIVVENKVVDRINRTEGTIYSKLFITKIFAILLEGTHSLVGDEVNIHYTIQRKNEVNFKNMYLISNEMLELFDINSFLRSIHLRLSERIEETYSLNIKGLISEYLKTHELHKIVNIQYVIEEIIYQEFEIVTINDLLFFERNTVVLNQDYAKEALVSLGISPDGYHINTIVSFLNERYPHVEFNAQSLANIMNRDKSIFICFGRQSTFGLKSWENEDVRGGTIREIVSGFLNDRTEPTHIDEILTFLKPFRATNAKNVLSNLILDESNTFAIFPGQFVGLKSKTYANMPKKLVGGLFTLNNLKKYSLQNFDEIVKDITSKYGYLPVQVSFILQEKIRKKEIRLNEQNQLIIDE